MIALGLAPIHKKTETLEGFGSRINNLKEHHRMAPLSH